MATITSTIRLVDRMSPTLNKISKSIDRVNKQSRQIGAAQTWSRFTAGVNTSTKSTHRLYYALRRVFFILGTSRLLRGIVTVADTMMNATARLGNLTNQNMALTAYYMDAIYAAAQRSRGDFMSMANSVGKLGTVAGHAFESIEEMIAFTELMNKLFVIGGASAAESSNAMYQLTQAMAAGRLQGDEMRSILENSPLLAQKIADYMGVTVGEVKELGAQGKITSKIIKEALFGAADEIEEKFENMPKTIGQIWTQIKNHAINAFRPVIERIQQFINSPMFERFQNKIYDIITGIANKVILFFELLETPKVQAALQAVASAFRLIGRIVSWVGEQVVNVARWICDNWSLVAPIIYGIVTALIAYKAILLVIQAIKIVIFLIDNWWLLAIIAVVAAIYYAVNAWNALTGSAVSGTGVILGCIGYVIALVVSLIQAIWAIVVAIVGGIVALVAVIIAAVSAAIIAVCEFFRTLWRTAIAIGRSLVQGCVQIGENIAIIWNNVRAWSVGAWWSMVSGAIEALNALVSGADSACTGIANFFIRIANKAIDAFNWIVSGWNNTIGKLSGLSITNPYTGTKYEIIGDVTFGEASHIDEISSMGWAGITNTAAGKAASAYGSIQSLKAVDWGWSEVGETWKSNWDQLVTDTKYMWNNANIGGVKLVDLAGNIGNFIKDTWTADLWMDPDKTFESWYNFGEKVDNGIGTIVAGIGALLSGMGGTINPATGEVVVPDSVNSLLGDGYGDTNDLLGDIMDNTGSSAGSAANIEDTLDLAEEELELLRKIAEKEIINRFTTAEIQVNMTNNNTVNSKMDLDGIVTHLSTRLHEELGVMASGVHY